MGSTRTPLRPGPMRTSPNGYLPRRPLGRGPRVPLGEVGTDWRQHRRAPRAQGQLAWQPGRVGRGRWSDNTPDGVDAPGTLSGCTNSAGNRTLTCSTTGSGQASTEVTALPGDYTLNIRIESAFTLIAEVGGTDAGTTTPTAADIPDPVLTVLPPRPTDFIVTVGDTELHLTWENPNNSGITGFQYRVSTDSSVSWNPDWTTIPNSDANTTTYTVTGLTNETVYTFVVRAVSGSLLGARPPTRSTRPRRSCPTPRQASQPRRATKRYT